MLVGNTKDCEGSLCYVGCMLRIAKFATVGGRRSVRYDGALPDVMLRNKDNFLFCIHS